MSPENTPLLSQEDREASTHRTPLPEEQELIPADPSQQLTSCLKTGLYLQFLVGSMGWGSGEGLVHEKQRQ